MLWVKGVKAGVSVTELVEGERIENRIIYQNHMAHHKLSLSEMLKSSFKKQSFLSVQNKTDSIS